MRLRPYQITCVEAIEEHLRQHGSTLAVLATGGGKTVVFSEVIRRHPKRCLVLAHRDELIQQAAEKLRLVTSSEDVGIEMGPVRASTGLYPPRIVVSSVQTMCRPGRRRQFLPAEFGLIVTDEAHHAVARTYQEIYSYFLAGDSEVGIEGNPEIRHLGVTATPKRADQLAMGQVFQSVAFDFGIEPMVEDGWLVPVRQHPVTVNGLDFSQARSTAGDLNEADLEEIVSQEKILHATAVPAVEVAGDLPTLVFCVTVKHAHKMAEVLDRYKPGSALALDGSTPREERQAAVERFRRGEIQFLCNCGLFLEGFDAPNTSVVVMARPTKSLALYTQVLGRGTRPLPGVVDPLAEGTAQQRRDAITGSSKPFMVVLDFVGNCGRHKIITAADLLGGKYGEPVRAYARQTAEQEGRPADVQQSLERAADELALLEEIRERKRRAAVRARAEYVLGEVSPFAGGPRVETETARRGDPPTEKQGKYLVYRMGWTWDQVARITKRQASAIIGKHRGES